MFIFGKYTVSISRYYNHYMFSAIIPAVVISTLVLSSLWMSSHATRLSMGITGLLTMTAIQVHHAEYAICYFCNLMLTLIHFSIVASPVVCFFRIAHIQLFKLVKQFPSWLYCLHCDMLYAMLYIIHYVWTKIQRKCSEVGDTSRQL